MRLFLATPQSGKCDPSLCNKCLHKLDCKNSPYCNLNSGSEPSKETVEKPEHLNSFDNIEPEDNSIFNNSIIGLNEKVNKELTEIKEQIGSIVSFIDGANKESEIMVESINQEIPMGNNDLLIPPVIEKQKSFLGLGRSKWKAVKDI